MFTIRYSVGLATIPLPHYLPRFDRQKRFKKILLPQSKRQLIRKNFKFLFAKRIKTCFPINFVLSKNESQRLGRAALSGLDLPGTRGERILVSCSRLVPTLSTKVHCFEISTHFCFAELRELH